MQLSSAVEMSIRQNDVVNTPPPAWTEINETTPTSENIDCTRNWLGAIAGGHGLIQCGKEVKHRANGDRACQVGRVFVGIWIFAVVEHWT